MAIHSSVLNLLRFILLFLQVRAHGILKDKITASVLLLSVLFSYSTLHAQSAVRTLTVYPDLFENMSGDKSQDILRLYFAEKNRTAFESNGFHVYDSDTVAAKYAAGKPEYVPAEADYRVQGSYYVFADLIEITLTVKSAVSETPDRIYTLKTNDARMDEEYSQLLLKAGKVIKADFKLPETFILYENPDTKDWLTRRYNRLFRPQTTSPPYKKAPPADGTYDPDYYIEYIRAETEDIMRNEKHEPLKNNRLDKLEKLAVILFGKYSEHAGIIAACAELAVLHKKRYQTAENFARKGLKANPLHSKLYLFLIMSAGTGSGEGKEAYRNLIRGNPFLDFSVYDAKKIKYEGGRYDTYLLKFVPQKTMPVPDVQTDFDIRFNYALSLKQQGQTANALEIMLELDRTYPGRDNLIKEISDIYNVQNTLTAKEAHLRFLLAALPRMKEPDNMYIRLAELYYSGSVFALAAKYYEKYYIGHPENMTVLENMTLCLINSTEYKKALFYSRKMVQKMPENPNGYYYAAVSALEGGDKVLTQKILDAAAQRGISDNRYSIIKARLAEPENEKNNSPGGNPEIKSEQPPR